MLARKKKKKQPKFTIREVDVNEFKRLQSNAKSMIRSRKKKYGVDISGEIDLRTDITTFKSRKEFNLWKESMGKLKNRADLQIRKTKEGTVASVKQINESNLEVKRNIKKWNLKPIEGQKGKYVSKYGVAFTIGELSELNLKTNVARDMELKRREQLENIPRYDRRGNIIKDTRKDKTEGSVIVREKFDPNKLQTPAKVKIRQEGLKDVSDPERYTRREFQLKNNQIKAISAMFGDDADDVIKYFKDMSRGEFNNFFFMYSRSSMGFDYIYQSGEYSMSEGSLDDRLSGVLDAIRTDIGRYKKIRKKYGLMEKYR